MAHEVNRIQAGNTNYFVGGINERANNGKANPQENEAPKTSANNEQKQVPAEDIMAFMNAQAAAVKPKEAPRVLDISKYVTPEQAKRIGDFVLNTCCASMDGYKEAIKNVVGNNILSDDAVTTLAAAMFDKGMSGLESFITPEQIGSFLAQFNNSVVDGLNQMENSEAKFDMAKELFEQ